MTRAEVRLRALRAAAAVTLTLGISGCGGDILVETGGGAETPPEEETGTTSGPEVPPIVADAGSGEDAGQIEDAGSGEDASIDAGEVADASDGGPLCVLDEQHWEAYAACCEKVSWSFEAGCMAWGPPVPPAMRVA